VAGWLAGWSRVFIRVPIVRDDIYILLNRVSSIRRGAAAVNYPRDNDDDHWLSSEVRDFIARLMSISEAVYYNV